MTPSRDGTEAPTTRDPGEPRLVLCLTADERLPALDDALGTDWRVEYVQTTDAAVDRLADPADCCLVDGRLDDAHGAVERLAEETLPVVFFDRDDDADSVQRAFDHGADESVSTAVPAAIATRIERLTDERRDARLLEQFLSGLMDETADTVYFKDEESRFVRVSRSKAREVGTTREALRGMSDFDFMTEVDAQKRYEDEQRIMETGEPYREDDERVVTPDGEVRWFQTVKLPRYDDCGNVVGTLGLSRDITELKELEETLAELERLVDRVPVWLLAFDASEVVTWANEAASTALSSDEALVGTTLSDLVEGPVEGSFQQRYEETVADLLGSDGDDNRGVVRDVALSLPDGRRRICNAHLRPLPTAEGRERGTVVAFHDVTEQIEQERTLERQYERLERLVQTVTHDLRNPLMVALGHVEHLSEELGDHDSIEAALGSLERMDTLIDELLAMAKVGQTVEETERVTLSTVAAEAWEPFADGPATLRVDADASFDADPGRLLRLFENLFRNAVDHAGSDCTVTVSATEDGFSVADDGPGIPPEEREQVFEHGFTAATRGTGFGLTIVAEIVSAHGWSIEITESQAGGTRFEIDTQRR